STPNTLVRNVSTSDSSNIHQNGSCSPDVLQKNILSGPVDEGKDGAVANQQSRSMDKSTEAGNAALLYFEAMLGTLKRTKENIGRATRIAIDCAKFGFATKSTYDIANEYVRDFQGLSNISISRPHSDL
ncbi:HUA2-like protein 3-like, partial [Trifolium medium]|nr:HUA2-like protein 3-like [Trifolium medium]